MVCWSGYTLLIIAARSDLATVVPVPLTVVTLAVGGGRGALLAGHLVAQIRAGSRLRERGAKEGERRKRAGRGSRRGSWVIPCCPGMSFAGPR